MLAPLLPLLRPVLFVEVVVQITPVVLL